MKNLYSFGYDYDLIVKDSEFKGYKKLLTVYLDWLVNSLESYGAQIDFLAENAVISGKAHDAIIAYRGYVERLQFMAEMIGDKVSRLFDRFISELERADDYLYDASISSAARNYSRGEFSRLMECLDDPISAWTDYLGDKISGAAQKIARLFAGDSARRKFQENRQALLDFNDETAQGLTLMFRTIYAVDAEFGSVRSAAVGNDSGCFDYVRTAMLSLSQAVESMSRLMTTRGGFISEANVSKNLNGPFSEMMKAYQKLCMIADRNTPQATIPQIRAFADDTRSLSYYSPFRSVVTGFMGELGGWDAAIMVFFKMFGIAKDSLTHLGYYPDIVRKKMLMEVLKEISASKNTYEMIAGDRVFDTAEDVSGAIKKAEKWTEEKIYEYLNHHRGEDGKLLLDGRTKEAKEFKKYIKEHGEAWDSAINILCEGKAATEFIARLLAQYDRELEILDSLKRNFSGNASMLKTINEAEALYRKEVTAWVNDLAAKVISKGIKVSEKLLEDSFLSVVKTISAGIDTVGNVTGLSEEANAKYDALIEYDLYIESNTAYQSALEKFRAADPNSEDYGMLADDLQNMFILYKSNLINLLRSMEDASSGTKKSYYHYCAGVAEQASMTDPNPLTVLTYEIFLESKPEIIASYRPIESEYVDTMEYHREYQELEEAPIVYKNGL